MLQYIKPVKGSLDTIGMDAAISRLFNWLSQLLNSMIQPLWVLMCPLAAALAQTTILAT